MINFYQRINEEKRPSFFPPNTNPLVLEADILFERLRAAQRILFSLGADDIDMNRITSLKMRAWNRTYRRIMRFHPPIIRIDQ